MQDRLRPLIYVYDLPAEYNSRMLQYRIAGGSCVYRRFDEHNTSHFKVFTYAIESGLHEWLLQSRHRTLDPEEADFFYVPAYTSCYMHPIWGPRVSHAAEMLLEVQQWLQRTLPFWDRKGGRDHLWLLSHDEGACWAPTAIWPSIMLTHWGRKDLLHTSNTAYTGDNYTEEHVSTPWRPSGWRRDIVGHPCYDPGKDLVIPAFKPPAHVASSPLLGGPVLERTHLLFFRGDVGLHRLPNYSRGIRQRLYNLSRVHNWQDTYGITIAAGEEASLGSYSKWLASSKFCLVAPGDGWSPRAEDAVLHGCIPVVIKDDVDEVFASLLDWSTFSIRIAEANVELVPQTLLNVTAGQLLELQQNLGLVWHRFLWTSPAMIADHIRSYVPDRDRAESIIQDDAFSTLMQWLYSRMT
eukprot:jgi/Astpho2/4390/Aster-00009